MIAQCKMCLSIIHPVSVLPLRPAQLAKIPAEQLELLKFSAGISEHMKAEHPEFFARVAGLAGNFVGHCALSAVEVAGERRHTFNAMSAADSAMLHAMWEAMPNNPAPEVVERLNTEAAAALEAAMREDEAEAERLAQQRADGAQPATGLDIGGAVLEYPGKIRLT